MIGAAVQEFPGPNWGKVAPFGLKPENQAFPWVYFDPGLPPQLGGADDACADSLWGGEVWVAGPIKSLGVDSKAVDPPPEEVASVEALLLSRGIEKSDWQWQKIVSGEALWHFESRDANSWLMI